MLICVKMILIFVIFVTTRFSLDLFYYLFMCVYMCLYVINCLCVYFGLGLVNFGVRKYYSHFRLRVFWSFCEQG